MSNDASIINEFNVFSEIKQPLVNKIKVFCLNKYDLLFATSDDWVYHYKLSDKQLKKFEPFCAKQAIIKFDCCYDNAHPYYMALTDNGCVYSWGDNKVKSGRGTTNGDTDEPKLANNLRKSIIIDICCGLGQSLVLTHTGHVYSFRSNPRVDSSYDNILDDHLTKTRIILPKVSAISCGFMHSVALTESGHVFVWGLSETLRMELSIDGSEQKLKPTKLNVPRVKQIQCGNIFTVMLSSDGDLYVISEIPMRLSNRVPIDRNPIRINGTRRFLKIAASMYSELLCVALSTDNECVVFDIFSDKKKRNESKNKRSKKTEFSSIEEIFASNEQITYKSIILDRNSVASMQSLIIVIAIAIFIFALFFNYYK